MINPKELYEKLLSETPKRHLEPFPLPKDVLDFISSKLGYSVDEIEVSWFDLIREIPKEIANRHSEEFAQFISDERYFYVGVLDLSEANAKAIPAPNGGWLIVVNWGLPVFLYEVARAISTRFKFQDSTGNRPFGESLLEFDGTCRYIAEIFAWYRGVGRPAAFDFPVHPSQVLAAGKLATSAEEFVVCHEMAHFMTGHVETPFNGRRYMANLPSDVPSSSWEQELEADRVGLRILWGRDDPALRSEQVDAYAGADFFLQVMSLFEELAEIPPAETHPPSLLRLKRLRDYAKSLCVDNDSWLGLFQLAGAIEQLFAQVREAILKPSPEQIERAKQRANASHEKLEQLLEVYASGIIPNYLSFSHEVVNMLSEYPSDAVCAAVASSMDETESYIQMFLQRKVQVDRIAYNKFKLLNHLLYLTPLPDGVRDAIELLKEKHSG